VSAESAADSLLEEARRMLVTQEVRMDDVRSRAITLLGSAGVVAGLFGLHLTTASAKHLGGYRTALLALALVAFVGVTVLAVLIHWAVKNWDEGERLDNWAKRIEHEKPEAQHFALNLAVALIEARANNAAAVSRRGVWFRWLCVLFAVEVSAWAIATVL
jgi:uncharacterized membrane protein